MNGNYTVGIDLGTSGIKMFICEKQMALKTTCSGCFEFDLKTAFDKLFTVVPPESIRAVGFSGQTGTYLLVTNHSICKTIHWYDPGREPYLAKTYKLLSQQEYLAYTGMLHPSIASYPIPTALYLKDVGYESGLIMQPKDYCLYLLSGEFVSDVGSWRGLAGPDICDFYPEILETVGLDRNRLPKFAEWTRVNANGAERFGLPEGTPLAIGYNDFYAALHGLNISEEGNCFDITGTSEHFGLVSKLRSVNAGVDSPYDHDLRVNYAVTASSGVSLEWGLKTFGAPQRIMKGAPVFLPCLRGERFPFLDPNARGMMVGITPSCGREELAYAVQEGVAFSIFSIYKMLNSPKVSVIAGTGGATASPLLNRMKASLIDAPYLTFKPDCGSSLGAAKAAGGVWDNEAAVYEPDMEMREILLERYEVFEKLYPAWKREISSERTESLFSV